jgi:YfiH family protein
VGVPRAQVRFTTVADGDLAVGSVGVDTRRRAIVDLPWTWLRQVHGAGVVVVERPGDHAGTEADAAVTRVPGAALAVQVADCAPVALLAADAVGAVHVGWRGLVAGVVPAAVDALRSLTDGEVRAVVGPTIGPECYEFGATDLDAVAAAVGPGVRARTADGRPALDLPAAVRSALAAAGVGEVARQGGCTACTAGWWSYRARGDRARQAVVAWLA